jgi:hypothetical protein
MNDLSPIKLQTRRVRFESSAKPLLCYQWYHILIPKKYWGKKFLRIPIPEPEPYTYSLQSDVPLCSTTFGSACFPKEQKFSFIQEFHYRKEIVKEYIIDALGKIKNFFGKIIYKFLRLGNKIIVLFTK